MFKPNYKFSQAQIIATPDKSPINKLKKENTLSELPPRLAHASSLENFNVKEKRFSNVKLPPLHTNSRPPRAKPSFKLSNDDHKVSAQE